jgi:hypothetical protein
MLNLDRLLVAFAKIGGVGFSVVLSRSYVKIVFTIVNMRFLSTRFLVLVVTKLSVVSSRAERVLAIIGLRLLSIRVLVIIVLGFLSASVISAGLRAGFSIILIILLDVIFLSLIKLVLAGRDAAACAKLLILLFLGPACAIVKDCVIEVIR